MQKFAIYSHDELVGYSSLECGDPPMGVAFGAFEPLEGYQAIQQTCRANHTDQSALNLTIRTSDGTVLQCAGVGILDFSEEANEPFIEVNVLGISNPPYSELFPQHVAAYERQFE